MRLIPIILVGVFHVPWLGIGWISMEVCDVSSSMDYIRLDMMTRFLFALDSTLISLA